MRSIHATEEAAPRRGGSRKDAHLVCSVRITPQPLEYIGPHEAEHRDIEGLVAAVFRASRRSRELCDACSRDRWQTAEVSWTMAIRHIAAVTLAHGLR